jgi:hypothetical protein
MGLALLATLLIEGLRPEGVMNRFVGPLNKGLAQKLGAAPPPMNGAMYSWLWPTIGQWQLSIGWRSSKRAWCL